MFTHFARGCRAIPETWSFARSAMFFFYFALSFIPTFDDASAAKRREPCDAVHKVAEIDYDSVLLVNVAGNRANNTCIFFVSLPPSGTTADATGRALAEFQTLFRSKIDFATADAKVAPIVPRLIDAILMPLKDKRFETPEAKALAEAVRARSKTIEECSALTLVSKAPLQKQDDVISCGVSDKDSRFTIRASLGSLSLALFIPLSS